MNSRNRRRPSGPCSPLLNSYIPALERIDQFLELANPEIEAERIRLVIRLLFGERPAITDFSTAQSPELQENP